MSSGLPIRPSGIASVSLVRCCSDSCAVNGPGEAGDADFGIAGGRDVGFVYAHGRVLKKVSSDILIDELFFEIDKWIADGMQRPKRLKMAKPAALAMAEASMISLD